MLGKTELNLLQEQINVLEAAIIDKTSNAGVYFNLGEIKMILGFYLEALMLFEQALEKDPVFLKAYTETAKIYIYINMHESAYRTIKKISSLSPYNIEGFILYGKLKEIYKENNAVIEKIDAYENFNIWEEELTSFQVSCQLKISQHEKLINEYKQILAEGKSDVKDEYSLRIIEKGLNFNKGILDSYNSLKRKAKKSTAAMPEAAPIGQNLAIQEILKEFLQLRSVMHAAIFDKEGSVISQVWLKPVYENIDYKVLIPGLSYINEWAQSSNSGTNFISFEFVEGLVFIQKMKENYYFVSAGEGIVNLASLKYTFDKNKENLLKSLQE